MAQQLTVARSNGTSQAFEVKADMFIAFSKKSPCLAQIDAFGRAVTAMRTNDSIKTIIRDAIKTWGSAQE
jgi:hypothetical protein